MTAVTPTTVSREELLELAALDAIGQLDEYEQSMFTRCFHHAPAAVQSEIIELQASLLSDPRLLPEVEPPAELRRKVLSSVARMIEQDSARHAPIAMIGRVRQIAAERGNGEHEGRTRAAAVSATFWRASSFVLAASLIIAIYLFADAYQYGKGIAEKALDNTTTKQLETLIGPTFREFIGNPNCRQIALLSPGGEELNGHAVLYVNETTGQAYLVVFSMPETENGEQYILQYTNTDGEQRALRGFAYQGAIKGMRFDNLEMNVLTATTWTITDSLGTVILTSSRA